MGRKQLERATDTDSRSLKSLLFNLLIQKYEINKKGETKRQLVLSRFRNEQKSPLFLLSKRICWKASSFSSN